MRIWSDPTRRRWLVFAVLVLGYMLVSVYRLSTAVLADQLQVAFGTSGAALGTLHAAFFYIYAALQLPAGVLADRLGSRLTVAGGTLVMSAGGTVFALADSYAAAFLGRALVGLGGGVLFIAILRFCANWFRPGEFATMNGVTMAVAGVGGVLATTPLAVAVGTFGWRDSVLGLAGVGVLVAALVLLLASDTPEDAGFDSISGVSLSSPSSLGETWANARTVFAERETWLAGAALFAGTGINITVFGLWGVPYVVQTYGLSVQAASTYTLLGSAGLLVGPPSIGWLSDRLGRRTELMFLGQLCFAGAFVLLAVVGNPPLPVVAACFFLAGALAGSYALGYTVIKERHDAAASGVATGAVNTLGFAGAAVLPTVMGAVLDTYTTGRTVGGSTVYSVTGYRVAFGLAAAVSLAACCCVAYLHTRERASAPDGEVSAT